MNLTNFIMKDGEDPSSRLITIDFEHANFLPMPFLVYSSWLTHDSHLSDGMRLTAHLRLNEIQMLHLTISGDTGIIGMGNQGLQACGFALRVGKK